jgi:hypothetical protein
MKANSRRAVSAIRSPVTVKEDPRANPNHFTPAFQDPAAGALPARSQPDFLTKFQPKKLSEKNEHCRL